MKPCAPIEPTCKNPVKSTIQTPESCISGAGFCWLGYLLATLVPWQAGENRRSVVRATVGLTALYVQGYGGFSEARTTVQKTLSRVENAPARPNRDLSP